MEIGVLGWVTDYSIDVRELAREVESAGFESLWFPEHTHVPVETRSDYPGGAPIGRAHSHQLDALVACGAAAAVTDEIKIGTAICIVPQHDPIALAKACATIDFVSGGRFLFGAGAGWNVEELANHGVDPRTRFRLFGEQLDAISRIWSDEVAEYHGTLVDFGPIWAWPKPVQSPRPPILIGGMGPRVLERVVAHGDGWLAMPAGLRYADEDLARVAELRRLGDDAGRGRLSVSAIQPQPDAHELERLEAAGVDRAIVLLRPRERDETLKELERCRRLALQSA